MRIETGYGLEGALPDQLAAASSTSKFVPRFRAGDWAGGLEAGIDGDPRGDARRVQGAAASAGGRACRPSRY